VTDLKGSTSIPDLYPLALARCSSRSGRMKLGFGWRKSLTDLGKVSAQRTRNHFQDEQTQLLDACKSGEFDLNDTDKQGRSISLGQPNLIERNSCTTSTPWAWSVKKKPTKASSGYLAATSSRSWTSPGIVDPSSSAAGQVVADGCVLRFIPEREQVGYSAMTGQSLSTWAAWN